MKTKTKPYFRICDSCGGKQLTKSYKDYFYCSEECELKNNYGVNSDKYNNSFIFNVTSNDILSEILDTTDDFVEKYSDYEYLRKDREVIKEILKCK